MSTPTTEREAFGWRFVAPLCIGAALNPINSTMVATAIVTIGRELQVGADQTVWLISIMYLSSAIGQPIAGRLADRIGPRKVFVAGSIIVAIAGIAGIFVSSLFGLVVLRAIIGAGTGAVYPSAMAMVRRRADLLGIPPPKRVLGMLTTASLTTLTIGPLLAGVLVQAVSWRWIFIFNFPLALLALAMVMAWAPRDEPAEVGRLRGDDYLGLTLFAASIAALLVFLMDLADPDWWVLATAVVALVALVMVERRTHDPFLDVRMIAANRSLALTYLRTLLGFTVIYAAMFGLSQWLEGARGLSPSYTGLLLLLIFGVGAVISLFGSRFATLAWPLLIGSAGLVTGSLVMAFVTSESPIWVYGLMCVSFAPSAGLSNQSNQMAIYLQTPASQIGAASGLSRTVQYLGAIIAAGVIALAYGAKPTDAGLHAIAWLMVILGLGVAAFTLLDRTLWRRIDAT